MLSVSGISVHYGDFLALKKISLNVPKGECISLVGANGAGKSTLLNALIGSLAKTTGSISIEDKDVTNLQAHEVVKCGISIVPEGRKLFSSLTVEENLLIGRESKNKGNWNLARVYQLFPDIEQKKNVPALSLSGGQQQMVSIGRALMTNPKVLLCDEISLGLSPKIIKDIYNALPEILSEGISIILVEQDLNLAISSSSYLYCLREGEIVLEGKSTELTRDFIGEAYFGVKRD
jgi:branched-chain amino acid transport system ATP-binding protein